MTIVEQLAVRLGSLLEQFTLAEWDEVAGLNDEMVSLENSRDTLPAAARIYTLGVNHLDPEWSQIHCVYAAALIDRKAKNSKDVEHKNEAFQALRSNPRPCAAKPLARLAIDTGQLGSLMPELRGPALLTGLLVAWEAESIAAREGMLSDRLEVKRALRKQVPWNEVAIILREGDRDMTDAALSLIAVLIGTEDDVIDINADLAQLVQDLLRSPTTPLLHPSMAELIDVLLGICIPSITNVVRKTEDHKTRLSAEVVYTKIFGETETKQSYWPEEDLVFIVFNAFLRGVDSIKRLSSPLGDIRDARPCFGPEAEFVQPVSDITKEDSDNLVIAREALTRGWTAIIERFGGQGGILLISSPFNEGGEASMRSAISDLVLLSALLVEDSASLGISGLLCDLSETVAVWMSTDPPATHQAAFAASVDCWARNWTRAGLQSPREQHESLRLIQWKYASLRLTIPFWATISSSGLRLITPVDLEVAQTLLHGPKETRINALLHVLTVIDASVIENSEYLADRAAGGQLLEVVANAWTAMLSTECDLVRIFSGAIEDVHVDSPPEGFDATRESAAFARIVLSTIDFCLPTDQPSQWNVRAQDLSLFLGAVLPLIGVIIQPEPEFADRWVEITVRALNTILPNCDSASSHLVEAAFLLTTLSSNIDPVSTAVLQVLCSFLLTNSSSALMLVCHTITAIGSEHKGLVERLAMESEVWVSLVSRYLSKPPALSCSTWMSENALNLLLGCPVDYQRDTLREASRFAFTSAEMLAYGRREKTAHPVVECLIQTVVANLVTLLPETSTAGQAIRPIMQSFQLVGPPAAVLNSTIRPLEPVSNLSGILPKTLCAKPPNSAYLLQLLVVPLLRRRPCNDSLSVLGVSASSPWALYGRQGIEVGMNASRLLASSRWGDDQLYIASNVVAWLVGYLGFGADTKDLWKSQRAISATTGYLRAFLRGLEARNRTCVIEDVLRIWRRPEIQVEGEFRGMAVPIRVLVTLPTGMEIMGRCLDDCLAGRMGLLLKELLTDTAEDVANPWEKFSWVLRTPSIVANIEVISID